MSVIEMFLRLSSRRFRELGIAVEKIRFSPVPNAEGYLEINYTLIYETSVYVKTVFFPLRFADKYELGKKLRAQVDKICGEIKKSKPAEQMGFKDLEC